MILGHQCLQKISYVTKSENFGDISSQWEILKMNSYKALVLTSVDKCDTIESIESLKLNGIQDIRSKFHPKVHQIRSGYGSPVYINELGER